MDKDKRSEGSVESNQNDNTVFWHSVPKSRTELFRTVLSALCSVRNLFWGQKKVQSVLRILSGHSKKKVQTVLSDLSVVLGVRTGRYFIGDAYIPACACHQHRHQAGRVTRHTLYI
jgi:hypothetical protein